MQAANSLGVGPGSLSDGPEPRWQHGFGIEFALQTGAPGVFCFCSDTSQLFAGALRRCMHVVFICSPFSCLFTGNRARGIQHVRTGIHFLLLCARCKHCRVPAYTWWRGPVLSPNPKDCTCSGCFLPLSCCVVLCCSGDEDARLAGSFCLGQKKVGGRPGFGFET